MPYIFPLICRKYQGTYMQKCTKIFSNMQICNNYYILSQYTHQIRQHLSSSNYRMWDQIIIHAHTNLTSPCLHFDKAIHSFSQEFLLKIFSMYSSRKKLATDLAGSRPDGTGDLTCSICYMEYEGEPHTVFIGGQYDLLLIDM